MMISFKETTAVTAMGRLNNLEDLYVIISLMKGGVGVEGREQRFVPIHIVLVF